MNSINTTIVSNTFNKNDLKELFDKEINDNYSELSYYGPEFDINNINKETELMMNIMDGI